MKIKGEKKIATKESADRNARKKMKLVLAAGLVLVIVDLAMTFSAPGISVEKAGHDLYITRPSAGEEAGHLSLKARVSGSNGAVEEKMDVTVEPYSNESQRELAENPGEEKALTEEEREEEIRQSLRDTVSGLKEAMRVLDGVEDIAICRLNEADVVRHVIVQRIIKAYEEDEKRKGKR